MYKPFILNVGMEHNGLDITITHIMIGIGSFFTVAVGRRMMIMMIMLTMMIGIMIIMSFIMVASLPSL